MKVSVDALLERGGGGVGCLKASPPATLAELHALSDALLCPDAAVVELTAKPDIRAATRGPLGKYFRVPEYARLSGNATTTTITAKTADLMQESEKSSDTYCVINYSSSDTSLATKVSSGATGPSPAPAFRGTTSLMEIRAFAERIGYPVLLKGPQQGAAMCHSWLQLRHLITTAKWAQNGGFIQRRTTGWEKCLAFAAYEGKLSGEQN